MPFPIDEVIPRIRASLSESRLLVLQAPPGAGKTTVVPPALLGEDWLGGQRILMLEPRRLAARGAAERMAAMMGEPPGETVGYRMRFERRVSNATRIEVITEGLLTRRLQQDPALEGVGLVIFDEFHERNLHSDLGLALCRDVMAGLRDDLRLLIMSATLDAERIAVSLGASVVVSAGRQYPVEVRYAGRVEGAGGWASAVRHALAEEEGDVLVFLPGAAEIRRTREALLNGPGLTEAVVHALYGDLPLDEQRRAILPDPDGRRKVVLATPIAETSLTIEGVRVVVDGGLRRAPRFDPRTGLTRLDTVRISAPASEQRRGRAGRLGPGVCYRLWSENEQRGLTARDRPEIATADLTPLALELAAWGVADADALPWLDSPPKGAMAGAWDLLERLRAVDTARRITRSGRAMAALPLHPRLAHMVVESARLRQVDLACDVAALLSERDPLRGSDTDGFEDRLQVLAAFRQRGSTAARALGADPGICRRVVRAAQSIRKSVGAGGGEAAVESTTGTGIGTEAGIGTVLALAYPDRIARRTGKQTGRFLLATGRAAAVRPDSVLAQAPYLVAASLDDAGDVARVRMAAPIDEEAIGSLFPASREWHEEVRWSDADRAVTVRRERRLGALVMASRPATGSPAAERIMDELARGVEKLGLDGFGWCREARALQARILSMRAWFPEEQWPDVSDEALLDTVGEWLPAYAAGVTRYDQLQRLDMSPVILGRLDWQRRSRLDQAAPERLVVPSGSRLRLEYAPGEAPTLNVKLQEMFGQVDTPRVADGRVPVTVALLSPAGRPVQVTRDLASFWKNAYAEVRRELRGRYPKHPWPEDPRNAVPTARTTRR